MGYFTYIDYLLHSCMILISQFLFTCADKYGLKLPAENDEDEELEGTPAAKPRKTPKKQSATKS
jgi:hypothetical protein